MSRNEVGLWQKFQHWPPQAYMCFRRMHKPRETRPWISSPALMIGSLAIAKRHQIRARDLPIDDCVSMWRLAPNSESTPRINTFRLQGKTFHSATSGNNMKRYLSIPVCPNLGNHVHWLRRVDQIGHISTETLELSTH